MLRNEKKNVNEMISTLTSQSSNNKVSSIFIFSSPTKISQ